MLNKKSNGRCGGTTNCYFENGKITKTDLIKDIKKGVYITELFGSGFNSVTGDFSKGGSGFLIENGEITYPISEITVAGNMFVPVELLEPIFNNMLQNGTGPNNQRAWLGINAIERQGRIQIVRVTPESPAQLAGVVPGLWLLGLNGKPAESLSAFYKQLWEIPISSKSAQLTIFDGRSIYQIPVPIVDRSTNIKKPAGV